MHERSDRAESIIRHLVANFVQEEANADPLITITRISLGDRGKRATVFVSVLPAARTDDALVFLTRKANDLRSFIKRHSRLMHIPHFTFLPDPDTLAEHGPKDAGRTN